MWGFAAIGLFADSWIRCEPHFVGSGSTFPSRALESQRGAQIGIRRRQSGVGRVIREDISNVEDVILPKSYFRNYVEEEVIGVGSKGTWCIRYALRMPR